MTPAADIIEDFRAAMRAAGVDIVGPILADGRLHRADIAGRRKNSRHGWYVLHLDEPASGAFGDYKTAYQDKWTARRGAVFSAAERQLLAARAEAARAERAREQADAHRAAAAAARVIWDAAGPAPADHPYLLAKRIGPVAPLRALAQDVAYVVHHDRWPRRTARAGALVLPLYGPDGALRSVQLIAPDGAKSYLTGTDKEGSGFTIGQSASSGVTTRIIAEGFATAATLHAALGLPVTVAFDAGNLGPVARALRAAHPDATLILAADDDRATAEAEAARRGRAAEWTDNPGLAAAIRAAEQVGGLVARPVWRDWQPQLTDFNDLAAAEGLDAVRAAWVPAMPRPEAVTADASAAGSAPAANVVSINEARPERQRRLRVVSTQPHDQADPEFGPGMSAVLVRRDGAPVAGAAPGGPAPGGEGGGRGAGPFRADPLDLPLASLPLTDLGNGERFRRRFGADFRWVPAWGWLAWDGRRWSLERADALVAAAVHDTVRAIRAEAEALRASGEDFLVETKRNGDPVMRSDKIRGWGMASQGNAHLSCIANLARPYLSARPEDFDADPYVLNVDNGTLRFARCDDGDYVTFHPHARDDLITKLASVTYDPAATCPAYDRFLEEVQPDPAMRRHLHSWGGVSLTGEFLQQFMFWYGKGRNGKSTLIEAWHRVAGDYGSSIPIESFLDQGRARGAGQATPDLAALPGVRMLRTSEPDKGQKLAEGTIKLITGGESMRVRNLNMGYFDLHPIFKMVMSGNYRPRIDGTDDGIWRRVLLVPWERQVAADAVDTKLPEKLAAESSGILNRLLDGLRDYLDHGLSTPGQVVDATAEYRTDSDTLGRFLARCVVSAPGERVQSSELYRLHCAYVKWAGEKEWTQIGFSRALAERGFRKKHSVNIYWLDIKLLASVSDFATEFTANT